VIPSIVNLLREPPVTKVRLTNYLAGEG